MREIYIMLNKQVRKIEILAIFSAFLLIKTGEIGHAQIVTDASTSITVGEYLSAFDQEHIRNLAEKGDTINEIRLGCDERGGGFVADGSCSLTVNLIGIDIGGLNAKISESDFSHVDLSYSNFQGVSFYSVDLSRSRLDFVDFSNTSMENVNISYSTIYAANFSDVNVVSEKIITKYANIVHPYVVTDDPAYPIPSFLDGAAQSFLRCSRTMHSNETFDSYIDIACTISYPDDGYVVIEY